MRAYISGKCLLASIIGLAMAVVLPNVASAALARAARHVSIHETVSTHLLQHHRTKLTERGSGSGTFSCPISLTLNLTSNSATIGFTCSPRAGSFSGSGHASVHYIGTIATFQGTIAISHGSGYYSHASGSGLHIKGTVQSKSYAITAQVTGSMGI